MRFVVIAVVLGLAAASVTAGDTKNWFDKLFSKPKQHEKPVKKKASSPKRKKTKPATKEKTFTVDSQWIANYRELEVLWDYEIPDDHLIVFENGKFTVPAVVYHHYEDMANSPKPRPTATP